MNPGRRVADRPAPTENGPALPAGISGNTPMAKAVLTYESGDPQGQSHTFEGEKIRIGRGSDNDLVTPGDSSVVSREQALIFLHDGHYWIEDLGSKHGTYVNDEPLTVQQMLVDGDSIRFGLTGPSLGFRVE